MMYTSPRGVNLHIRDDEHGKAEDLAICDEVQTRDVYGVCSLGFKPRIVVDVGAHIGTFTTLAAALWPECWVFAFEPEAHLFNLLAVNAPARSTIVRAPVLGFYGEAATYRGEEFEQVRRGLPGAISCRTLLKMTGMIDLLKIDCEGSEVAIFRELAYLLELTRIPVIVGEYHGRTARLEIGHFLRDSHELTIGTGDGWEPFCAVRRKPSRCL